MIDDDQILDSIPNEANIRRRKLLPMWIIVFCWIFMVMAALSLIGIFAGFVGSSFHLSLYGIDTNDPLSRAGLSVLALFLLKGLVGFGLWMEKSWAVTLGILDGLIGTIICIVMMVVPGLAAGLRLELVLIIPYIIKLKKIKTQWEGINQ